MSSLIQSLRSSTKLEIRCPTCSESFSPRQASLFDIREAYPKRIRNYLQRSIDRATRTNLAADKKLATLGKNIVNSRADIRHLQQRLREKPKRIRTITQYVNIGQILEKILPASPRFEYDPADCRSIFDPIDYVCFHGLSRHKSVESITLIEIKTGGALLQPNQKDIRAQVEANKTILMEY